VHHQNVARRLEFYYCYTPFLLCRIFFVAMAPRFLISVDVGKLDQYKGGIDFKTIFYLGHVYMSADEQNYTTVLDFVGSNVRDVNFYVDVTSLHTNYKAITELLDSGVSKVFVCTQQLQDIVDQSLVEDLSRLILSPKLTQQSLNVEEAAHVSSSRLRGIPNSTSIGLHLSNGADLELLAAVAKARGADASFPDQYATMLDNSESLYHQVLKSGFVPILPADFLTTDPKTHADRMSIELLYTTLLTSDRSDGLYTTLVVDERGVSLGLVYSSDESIREAIKTGKGVYQSRKRGLWRKGESSGDTQDLIRLDVDCDSDTLLFVVKQNGDGMHYRTVAIRHTY